jgi:hypothetical protein
MEQYHFHLPLPLYPKSCPHPHRMNRCPPSPSFSFSFAMVALSPTPSFPGAWPDLSLSDLVPPLPDKYISSETDTPEEDDSPQDISPSLHCLSPRPLPELPSLSSSLSTANSSVTDGPSTPSEQPCFPVEVQRLGTPLGFPNDSSTPPEKPCSPDEVQRTHTPLSLTNGAFTPPEEPCSPVEVRPSCMPLQTQLPIILDLREPHSPDTAHFSPPDDSISFPSPSSSHFRLSLSNNCSGARSAESVATFLPSPSRPSTPDGERGAFREEVEGRPDPLAEEITNLCLQGDQEDHSLHAAKTPVGKRTFLSRVKRLGGRVRKLFKPRVAETKLRRNSVSHLCRLANHHFLSACASPPQYPRVQVVARIPMRGTSYLAGFPCSHCSILACHSDLSIPVHASMQLTDYRPLSRLKRRIGRASKTCICQTPQRRRYWEASTLKQIWTGITTERKQKTKFR